MHGIFVKFVCSCTPHINAPTKLTLLHLGTIFLFRLRKKREESKHIESSHGASAGGSGHSFDDDQRLEEEATMKSVKALEQVQYVFCLATYHNSVSFHII